jgi:hypothetical protein
MANPQLAHQTSLSILIEEADREFFARHPERKGSKLTQAPEELNLRIEWNDIFSKIAIGKVKAVAGS